MFAALAKNIFGSANDRYVRSLGKYVDAVNALRHWYDVSDAAILAATASLDDPDEIVRRGSGGPGGGRVRHDPRVFDQ